MWLLCRLFARTHTVPNNSTTQRDVTPAPSLSVFGETPRASGFGLQGMTGDQSRDQQQPVGRGIW
jgi:hypothetical protein